MCTYIYICIHIYIYRQLDAWMDMKSPASCRRGLRLALAPREKEENIKIDRSIDTVEI